MSNVIGPGRAYTVCFGGISTEDARFRVGRHVLVVANLPYRIISLALLKESRMLSGSVECLFRDFRWCLPSYSFGPSCR